ncbi:MAG: type I methionyl aminopeptidase [Planctomycetota bacterium]|jgi:methionyl aminopeptidase
MAITLKSRREIDLMRKAGIVVADVLLKLQEVSQPGVTTGHLDRLALRITEEAGGDPLFKGVKSPYARLPFPGAICASVNQELVHGIPSDEVKLKEGDILSIDFGIRLNGYCADAAVTFGIGNISEDKQRLLQVTREVLDIAVANTRASLKWSQVAGKMQKHAESAGFSVVRDYVGHGIGREMHEDPKVPNFVNDELLMNDIFLAGGMVFAVEPMITAGASSVKTLRNGWTVVTRDGKCSAHFEHTIVVLKDGCEVLTVK